ncbi:uncharacterized protein LOC128819523 [Vidua macroura]|uniref:uncharacterized protein LOC128819523 n=1 Tax=Vidua macroura TaxID=187451 RepID=UPI0023A7B313|nr:uncharacterized protein LOC128819523 [Vidua macroura]
MEIGLQRGAAAEPEGSCCEPALLHLELHLERLLLLGGLREVDVVEGCHCSTCPEEWLWLPALKTFPDSPWEVCKHMPTKFSTALFKNSHGGEVVQTLESCEMKKKCYCVSQVEYYEIVQSSAGHREEQVKEIDVGRCLGSCSSGDPCLLRFRSRRDQVRTVAAIQECRGQGTGSCGWGSWRPRQTVSCKINIVGNLQVLGAPLCSSTAPLHPASQEDAAVWHGLGVHELAAPACKLWSRRQ